MRADLAVFSTASLNPQTIEELAKMLPFSRHTIYKSVERLSRANLLSKQRLGKQVLVGLGKGYQAAKLQEICIKALSRGIDPVQLLSQSKRIARLADFDVLTPGQVQERTGVSVPTALRLMKSLEMFGLAKTESTRPLTIRISKSDELLKALLALEKPSEEKHPVMLEERPYVQRELLPQELERRLYRNVAAKTPFAIEGVNFVTRGVGKLELLSSLRDESGERKFMRHLFTPDGVEDTCIRMLRENQIDYDHLFELARKERMVNVVGCYLEILRNIDETMVAQSIIDLFKRDPSRRRRHTFLRQLKQIGKDRALHRYERDWNLDLYLDLDAIAHGVRA